MKKAKEQSIEDTYYGALLLRITVALEKISRHLGAIEECLLTVTDGNDKTIRMKDIKRAEVYKTHLGKKMRQS